ncbi:MAG: tyrosine-type recombinase/integrase [Methyloligellaceae bacterium]
MPLKIFEDIRIRKDLLSWRDELAINSAKQADYMWSVFRRVIQYAVHNGEITHNHLKNPGRLYKADRSDKIWLPEDVEKFMCSCSPELQTALALALHTGQRKGDLIRLSWTAYDGTGISLRQSKSNRKVYIPATQTLKSILDSLPRTAVTILTNTKGTPWTSDGFNTSWGKAAKRAKIEGLTFHDLRGTAVTLLAEQGCTSIEIASITGHSLKHVETILDHYGSRTKKIAQTAILRFEQSWVSEIGKLGKRNAGETKVTK